MRDRLDITPRSLAARMHGGQRALTIEAPVRTPKIMSQTDRRKLHRSFG